MLPNLQIFFVEKKGIHIASAHLWIKGLFQTTKEVLILFCVGRNQHIDLLSVSDKFTDPWKQVIHLLKK